jgi:hypothetical protein
VLLVIFRNDLATLDLGPSVSRNATFWLLLLATWLLTHDCLRIAHEAAEEWNHAAKKIKDAKKTQSLPLSQVQAAASTASTGG